MIIAFADLRLAISALRREDASPEPWRTWNEAIDRVLALVDEHAARAAAEAIDGKDEIRRAGKHVGGDVPYGRRLGEDGATLLEHEAEAELVRVALELRAGGMAYAAIVRELAARKMVARTGKPFAPAQIRRFCLAAGIDPREQPVPAPAARGTVVRAQPEPEPVPPGTMRRSTPHAPAPSTRGTKRRKR